MCSWVGISSVWLVGTKQFLMVGPRHSHHILLGSSAEWEDACFPATAGARAAFDAVESHPRVKQYMAGRKQTRL